MSTDAVISDSHDSPGMSVAAANRALTATTIHMASPADLATTAITPVAATSSVAAAEATAQ